MTQEPPAPPRSSRRPREAPNAHPDTGYLFCWFGCPVGPRPEVSRGTRGTPAEALLGPPWEPSKTALEAR
eukprot:4974535-Pyramimonas_sp.AAC.1